MARPTPFFLYEWINAWGQELGARDELQVEVAFRDGQLVGALPLCTRARSGLRVASFLGSPEVVLGDVLLASGEDPAMARALGERARSGGIDLAELVGVPAGSRLAGALDEQTLHLVKTVDAPVMDLRQGWPSLYESRTPSKHRAEHERRRRGLAKLGELRTRVISQADELDAGLDRAFHLHAIRWAGSSGDGSPMCHAPGRRFLRAATRALAGDRVPRLALTELDGRPIAFSYYLVMEGRFYGYEMGFDSAFARYAPGTLNQLDTFRAASEEGLTVGELLAGAARHKLAYADHVDPIYTAYGLAGTGRGRTALQLRLAYLRGRGLLRDIPPVARAYRRGRQLVISAMS